MDKQNFKSIYSTKAVALTMINQIVDLDHLHTWPELVRAKLNALHDVLLSERIARRKYDLSGDRWTRPSPPSPFTEEVYAIIADAMKHCRIRVFHATRLLDFDEIKRDGLRPLVLQERIDRLKQLTGGPLSALADKIDDLIAKVDVTDDYFSNREALVWATPMRRSLHDGGCDVFFEHWGGEAIQRLASMTSATLEKAIQSIGTAAVVVLHIPAFGFCESSHYRLPPTMLDLALEASGALEITVGGWDVRSRQAVSSEWIEAVLSPRHPNLAG